MKNKESPRASLRLNEDWWAVIVAFILILLSVLLAKLGLLGEHGLQIKF